MRHVFDGGWTHAANHTYNRAVETAGWVIEATVSWTGFIPGSPRFTSPTPNTHLVMKLTDIVGYAHEGAVGKRCNRERQSGPPAATFISGLGIQCLTGVNTMFSKTPYMDLLEIFWNIHEEQTTGYDKDDYDKWLLSFNSCPEMLCRKISINGGLRALDRKLWFEIRKRHDAVVPGHISFKSREEMYKCKVCGFEIPCDAMYPLCNLHDKYRECSWCNELVSSVDKNRRCKEHERVGTCCVCDDTRNGVLKGHRFFCDEHSNMILCSVCESWCDDPEERHIEGHTIQCCKEHGDLNWCEYGHHPIESEITETIEGEDACEECNDDDDIETCDCCDDRVHIHHTTYAGDTCYCESCAEYHVYYCVECDEYFDDDECHQTDAGIMCDDCYWDVHFPCDLCGEPERVDDKCTIITGPSSEISICYGCSERIESFHCENARENVETCFCPVKSDLIDKIEKIATKLDLCIEPRDDILDRIIAAL